jgi:hypothetical protein
MDHRVLARLQSRGPTLLGCPLRILGFEPQPLPRLLVAYRVGY